MLYEMFKFEDGLWIKCGKSTNAFYARKQATLKNLKLTEYETGRIIMSGYEPPEIQAKEDRSVRQLRKDAKWVASQVFVNA